MITIPLFKLLQLLSPQSHSLTSSVSGGPTPISLSFSRGPNMAGAAQVNITDDAYVDVASQGILLPIVYSFGISLKPIESHSIIFDCEYDLILENPNYGRKLATAVMFENAATAIAFVKESASKPCSLRGFMIFHLEGKYFVLGQHVGKKIEDWMRSMNPRELWEWDEKGGVRPTRLLARVGKNYGKMINVWHSNDQCLGIALGDLFINVETLEFTMVHLDCDNTGVKLELGIINDLNTFRDFVNLCGDQIPQGLKSVTFDLFEELRSVFPSAANLEHCKQLSYVLCHYPLFWEGKERMNFSAKFWEFGQVYSNFFKVVDLGVAGTPTHINKNWSQDIPRGKNSVLLKIFNHRPKMYDTSVSIVPFHRNAVNHFGAKDAFATKAEIDKKLLNAFPHALSKAYVEMFKKCVPRHSTLIEDLKRDPHSLNYVKEL